MWVKAVTQNIRDPHTYQSCLGLGVHNLHTLRENFNGSSGASH